MLRECFGALLSLPSSSQSVAPPLIALTMVRVVSAQTFALSYSVPQSVWLAPPHTLGVPLRARISHHAVAIVGPIERVAHHFDAKACGWRRRVRTGGVVLIRFMPNTAIALMATPACWIGRSSRVSRGR